MSDASRRADAGAPDRTVRLQRWTAALLTALLHVLLVLLVTLSPPVTVTVPQAAAAGSPMQVTYIDDNLQPPPPVQPPARKAPTSKRPKPPRAAARVQTTLVTQANDPVPADAVDTPDRPTTAPPDVPDAAAPREAPAPVANPPRPNPRRSPAWGQPPGMLPPDAATANAGPSRGLGREQGRRAGASSAGPDLEVDGYQVYYDLISDARLRAWRDRGMTELFLPLPGTRRLMVCPLEVALRRGSGKCRMVEPDADELKTIGDARDVLNMQRVYKLGDEVWSGPGPYK